MKKLLGILLVLSTFDAYSCDSLINPGSNIQSSLNSIGEGKTLCLNPGNYHTAQKIFIHKNQTLKGNVAPANFKTVKIISSSTTSIISTSTGSNVNNLAITSAQGTLPTYGVLIYADQGVTLWNIEITKAQIGIGITQGSDHSRILNVFIEQTGVPNTGNPNIDKPDPSIWVNQSDDIEIFYGAVIGADNGYAGNQGFLLGDGEVACHNSNNFSIKGTSIWRIGTSAVYLVNCDNAVIDNTYIWKANGFGVDIVDGSDNVTVKNNRIYWSGYGAGVFDSAENLNGDFINNDMRTNNYLGISTCSGINVFGSISSITFSGNTNNTGPIYCGL